MSDPKDKPTLEKPSSTKQQSPKGNNFLIEKSDGGDDVIGGDEGQNKIVDVAAAAAAAPVSGSSSSRPVIFGSRKRGRIDSEAGADVVNDGCGSKEMKKEGLEVPRREPTCYVCKKGFETWRAMFGHLKAHQRQTPGAFPPPSFTPPKRSPEKNNLDVNALKEQLAPTLLNLAYKTMHKMSQDESSTNVVAGDALSLRGGGGRLDIDLNEPKTSFLLDLNKSPPPENDDDDEDEDDQADVDAHEDDKD
ncbi:hypothetical protein V6N13_044890 [Hibiscus sabdariffa]|uniref:C2H2-type domain-containing protein n=1 Tax=Hibiscus sabdariffa TaxID=183260 RepID=A0ABR2RJV6_9ROSI